MYHFLNTLMYIYRYRKIDFLEQYHLEDKKQRCNMLREIHFEKNISIIVAYVYWGFVTVTLV